MPLSGCWVFFFFLFAAEEQCLYFISMASVAALCLRPFQFLHSFRKNSLVFICWSYPCEKSNGIYDRECNGQYTREIRKLEPQWKCKFPVLLYSTSREFSHMACRTFLNEGGQLSVCTWLLPILVFFYSWLREVILHTSHMFVHLNLYPHIIHAV